MSNEEVVDIFFKVLDKYINFRYTQEAIAKEFNISIEAVAFCTQKAGIWHTSAKNGLRGVFYTDEPMFTELKMLLEKNSK